MFKIYQRYIASQFIPPFFFATLFFVIFLLTSQLFKLIEVATSQDVGIEVVLELMGHIGTSFLPMSIPLAALLASIYVTNKLSEDSEIIAFRAFGVTKEQLYLPLFLCSIVIAITTFTLNRNLIPYSSFKFRNTIIKMTTKGMIADIKAGQFFTEIPNITLFAEKVEDNGTLLKDIFIQSLGDDEQIIFAEKGVLIKQELGGNLTPSIRLKLTNGNIVKTDPKVKGEIKKVIFKEYDFPVVSGGHAPGFVTKDRMRSNEQLTKIIKKREETLKRLEGKKNRTQAEQKRYDDIKHNLPRSKLEYWVRWNTPLQVIIFIFLGFGLGIKKARGTTHSSGRVGLLFLVAYYGMFFGGFSFAKKGAIPAYFAVFIPTAIALVVAIRYFRKVDWMS